MNKEKELKEEIDKLNESIIKSLKIVVGSNSNKIMNYVRQKTIVDTFKNLIRIVEEVKKSEFILETHIKYMYFINTIIHLLNKNWFHEMKWEQLAIYIDQYLGMNDKEVKLMN